METISLSSYFPLWFKAVVELHLFFQILMWCLFLWDRLRWHSNISIVSSPKGLYCSEEQDYDQLSVHSEGIQSVWEDNLCFLTYQWIKLKYFILKFPLCVHVFWHIHILSYLIYAHTHSYTHTGGVRNFNPFHMREEASKLVPLKSSVCSKYHFVYLKCRNWTYRYNGRIGSLAANN